jgi:hypothetical protein
MALTLALESLAWSGWCDRRQGSAIMPRWHAISGHWINWPAP